MWSCATLTLLHASDPQYELESAEMQRKSGQELSPELWLVKIMMGKVLFLLCSCVPVAFANFHTAPARRPVPSQPSRPGLQRYRR